MLEMAILETQIFKNSCGSMPPYPSYKTRAFGARGAPLPPPPPPIESPGSALQVPLFPTNFAFFFSFSDNLDTFFMKFHSREKLSCLAFTYQSRWEERFP